MTLKTKKGLLEVTVLKDLVKVMGPTQILGICNEGPAFLYIAKRVDLESVALVLDHFYSLQSTGKYTPIMDRTITEVRYQPPMIDEPGILRIRVTGNEKGQMWLYREQGEAMNRMLRALELHWEEKG